MFTTMMHKFSVLILLLPFVISGCSSPSENEQRKQAIESAQAVYANGAIQLKLKAEPMLNAFNDTANSCTVVIVQSKQRAQLDKLLNNPTLLRTVFNGNGVSEGLLQIDSYTMMPGQTVALHIDRVEESRYIAVIAGYYPAPDKNHTRVYSLPLSVTQQGWFNKSWTAQYVPARIALTLGRNAIVQSGISAVNAATDVVYADNPSATK